jgi:hypothetical protein
MRTRALGGGVVTDCVVNACVSRSVVSCSAANGRTARAREMVHAPPGSLGLTQLRGFRFRRIQRVRIDVRRPHCRRNQKPTHYRYQTKTAPSQLGHLVFVPRFPGFLDRSYVRPYFRAHAGCCTNLASRGYDRRLEPICAIVRELEPLRQQKSFGGRNHQFWLNPLWNRYLNGKLPQYRSLGNPLPRY